MRINGLVVSHDAEVQQLVAKVFATMDLRSCEDHQSAIELIERNHFDGFIIDCDGLERGAEIVAAVRSSRSNQKSVVFAITSAKTSTKALELGSNFVLPKPLDFDHLSTYFQSSILKMEAEHRRYFRYELSLDAEVVRNDGKVIPAQVLNVSDGGVAVRLLDGTHLHGSVAIWFRLPDAQKTRVTAAAMLCWARGPIFGMKFLAMPGEIRKQYADWLSSMALV
ncbi:MAG TPA: PilZ domain-containing protein [Terriglobales bacterium]|nr:PilZ domain-containing protein [Terriglobales bacterium]